MARGKRSRARQTRENGDFALWRGKLWGVARGKIGLKSGFGRGKTYRAGAVKLFHEDLM